MQHKYIIVLIIMQAYTCIPYSYVKEQKSDVHVRVMPFLYLQNTIIIIKHAHNEGAELEDNNNKKKKPLYPT